MNTQGPSKRTASREAAGRKDVPSSPKDALQYQFACCKQATTIANVSRAYLEKYFGKKSDRVLYQAHRRGVHGVSYQLPVRVLLSTAVPPRRYLQNSSK